MRSPALYSFTDSKTSFNAVLKPYTSTIIILGIFPIIEYMEIFRTRIKELRLESGLTQKQLAEKLNTTNSAVCDWEKGRTQPDLQMLVNIAGLFGVSVDYLLGLSDD